MPIPTRGTLQLDFDGTLAHGDVSTGILARFSAPHWLERVESAGRQLLADPGSTALIDAMAAGFASLTGTRDDHLRFAREHHPPRPGLSELIGTAESLGLDCHVVSNGFEFYIRDYLRSAGVEEHVAVHAGSADANGRLAYPSPDGPPVRSRFKTAWAEHFLASSDLLIYAGDGSSDVPPAALASIVFARDSLLSRMQPGFRGTLRPYDTLHDIARSLRELLARVPDDRAEPAPTPPQT